LNAELAMQDWYLKKNLADSSSGSIHLVSRQTLEHRTFVIDIQTAKMAAQTFVFQPHINDNIRA
jgi:hypothetical protein